MATKLSQQTAVDVILAGNPTINSITGERDAAKIGLPGVSQLQGPELEGEYMFGSGADNKWSVGVSQGFNWPGVYSARRDAAASRLEVENARISAARIQLALDARLLMIDGVYATLRLDILGKLRANLDSVARAIDYGYEKGELTVLDVKKIRHELFQLDTRIAAARGDLDDVMASLNALSGRSDLDVDMSAYYPMPLLSLDSYTDLLSSDPEVLTLNLTGKSQLYESRAASLERYPGFSVGYRHAFEEGHHFNGFTLGIGLPSWGKNYNSKMNEALSHNNTRYAEALMESKKSELDGYYKQALKLQTLMNNYSKVVLDDEYIELLMLAYHGGQINVITMIQEINYYLSSTLDYLDTDHSYRILLARINRLSQL